RRGQSLLGAGARHLHVCVDGEIRRRARGPYRHSRRRRCPGQAIGGAGPQACDRVRAAVRRIVHRRDRYARRHLRPRSRSRSGVAGALVAELDHLSLHSARLVPDVLPIPASNVVLSAHRLGAASGSRRRLRGAARGGAGCARRGGAMSVLSPASKPAATPLGDKITAALIIAIPIALALVCFAARLHIIELSHTVRAELLFALLLALMASGMPISIALGLSVLTYLFILSDVDPKMVGLKLFTSIDRFEIM